MRILLTFGISFAAASAAGLLTFPGAVSLWLGALLCVYSVVSLIFRRVNRAAVLALGFSVGIFWCIGYQTLRMDPALLLCGQTELISGVVADYSTTTSGGIRVEADISIREVETSAVVWLSTEAALSPGDRFTAEAKLSDARQDGSYYYWADGIYVLAYGTTPPEIQPAARRSLRYLPRYISHKLKESLFCCVPADASGYAVALSTGDRSGLSALEKEHLKTAGIYHALALSGMHLTTLLGTVFLFVRQRRKRAVIGISLSVIFTVITGAPPSMVRACVMQCLVLLAPVLDREADAPTSLAAAALFLLLLNPCCLLGWNTQLSFTSMAGIILFSGKLQNAMLGDRTARKRRSKRYKKLLYAVTGSFSTTFSAMLPSLPLMMLYFGMFSLVAPLTNLLTGWVIAWTFRLSLLTGIAGMLIPGLGTGLGWILSLCVRYVSAVTAVLSRIPFAALYTNSVYVVLWVAFCYGVFALLLVMPKNKCRFITAGCCMVILLTVCIGFSLLENIGFIFTVLDVGQGQCLLAWVNEQTLMIDCGGPMGEAVGDTAAAYLNSLGEQRIDLLILTHYDSDHVCGVPELLRRVQVDKILMPDLTPEDETRREIEAAAAESQSEILYVNRELSGKMSSCQLSVFPAENSEADRNNSLAVLLSHGGTEILITGDMDAADERRLLRNHAIPDVDILVAGHHGSRYSTSQTLLSTVKPEIVVVSVGEKNTYGHPAPETLERISEFGAVIYRTDLHGTLRLKGA